MELECLPFIHRSIRPFTPAALLALTLTLPVPLPILPCPILHVWPLTSCSFMLNHRANKVGVKFGLFQEGSENLHKGMGYNLLLNVFTYCSFFFEQPFLHGRTWRNLPLIEAQKKNVPMPLAHLLLIKQHVGDSGPVVNTLTSESHYKAENEISKDLSGKQQ